MLGQYIYLHTKRSSCLTTISRSLVTYPTGRRISWTESSRRRTPRGTSSPDNSQLDQMQTSQAVICFVLLSLILRLIYFIACKASSLPKLYIIHMGGGDDVGVWLNVDSTSLGPGGFRGSEPGHCFHSNFVGPGGLGAPLMVADES